MSQKKVLLYSPEGKEEWVMECDAPAGWTPQPPVTEEDVAASEAEEEDLRKQVEEMEGDVQPGDGDGTLKGSDPEVPEHTNGLTDVNESAEEAEGYRDSDAAE
jgi:hypothetical protein